jgi:hypothetical protein
MATNGMGTHISRRLVQCCRRFAAMRSSNTNGVLGSNTLSALYFASLQPGPGPGRRVCTKG